MRALESTVPAEYSNYSTRQTCDLDESIGTNMNAIDVYLESTRRRRGVHHKWK
jgi:hypothetical protein